MSEPLSQGRRWSPERAAPHAGGAATFAPGATAPAAAARRAETTVAGAPAGPLAHLVDAQRLVVCLGSGGVGKTTAAAALALAAARRGRRAAVLTVDPARRLRDTLGIETLGNDAHRVPLRRVHPGATGTLDAMLLDVQRTFDELIRRYAPSEAAAERLLANRIYQSLSTALAGSQEYMAMERMHALAASGRYDLLVVDTPPTQHALDFLEAPERLIALLSSRAAAILQNPSLILSREGSRLAQAALAAILRGLERFTGLEVLRDLADLAGGFEELSEGFRARAAAVSRLLRAPETSCLLVTTAEGARVAETLAFHRELRRARLPVAGFVVNRILPGTVAAEPPPAPETAAGRDAALARKLAAVHRRLAAVRAAERAEIARLARAAPDALRVEVPLQSEEPTSLARLAALGTSLA
jgi:anion-transporting  ArsA/GET3 family ATPase